MLLRIVQRVGHIGCDKSGRNAVDGNTAGTDFSGDGFAHSDRTGLGGSVVRLAGIAHHADDGGYVNDATGFHHAFEAGAGKTESACEIRFDHFIPLRIFHTHGKRIASDAGVVH